jgi:hypothetical protein
VTLKRNFFIFGVKLTERFNGIVWPKDQLPLDPQVIGRITLGLKLLDNKGAKGDNFMDFYYMNKYYAKHQYRHDSKPEKLIRYI